MVSTNKHRPLFVCMIPLANGSLGNSKICLTNRYLNVNETAKKRSPVISWWSDPVFAKKYKGPVRIFVTVADRSLNIGIPMLATQPFPLHYDVSS